LNVQRIHKGSFDAPQRRAYVNALFIIGTLGTLISPALLAAWSTLHWSQSQLGLVAGIELAAMGAGSLTAVYWQRRWLWRPVALGALLVAVIANAFCATSGDLLAVSVARGLIGLAGGLLCGIYSAFLANIKSPVRLIAITTFVQIGIEAIFVFFTPLVIDRLSFGGLFAGMAVLFAMLIPCISALPQGWPITDPESAGAAIHNAPSWRGYPLLLSFASYSVVQTGAYAFLGDFGQTAAHLSAQQTLRTIGVSLIFSALGPAAAYALDERGGLLVPIAGSIAVMACAIFGAIWGSPSALTFFVSISLLQIAWAFLICKLYSALIEANNLLVPAATTVSVFGSALGASLMGYLLDQRGLAGALSLSMGAVASTALLTLPFLRFNRASAPAQQNSAVRSIASRS
jgi:predicted MFS family arabinose efflux permease